MTNRSGNEINWADESRRFDAVADLYDAHRPGYPPELIESVLSLTGIQPGGAILEVGCGTGQATRPFAERGFPIHCIEPGKNLAAVAAQRLQSFPRVSFEQARFEDWQERSNAFDLVISAQAFHWVPQPAGYAKVGRALKAGGHMALFWNMYPAFRDEMRVELDQVYRERAPELAAAPRPIEDTIKQRQDEIAASGHFGPVTVKRFPWSARYDVHQYLGLLNTYSDHLRLPERTRQHLFEGVADLIGRHGGHIERPYIAVLYVAPGAA